MMRGSGDILNFTISGMSVFEDNGPRLADLNGDGQLEVWTMRSDAQVRLIVTSGHPLLRDAVVCRGEGRCRFTHAWHAGRCTTGGIRCHRWRTRAALRHGSNRDTLPLVRILSARHKASLCPYKQGLMGFL
jgi:hypothetical protein